MTRSNAVVHWLDIDGAANARAVVPGVLLRSDNLQDLTPHDVRLLIEEEQLEVVIDLRTEVEVAFEGPGPLAAEPGVRIEVHSVYPPAQVDDELEPGTVNPWGVEHFDESLSGESGTVQSYFGYLVRRPDSIVAAVRAIANSGGAVLVNCAAGKDRTGTVVALALDAAGVKRTVIAEDYLRSTERIPAILERLAKRGTYQGHLGTSAEDVRRNSPVPGTIERLLELVDERLGGTVAYLRGAGLSEPEFERLRERLWCAGESRVLRDGRQAA